MCNDPRRYCLRRIKGWRKPLGAVVVTRPGPFGNPFQAGRSETARRLAVDLYREWLTRPAQAALRARIRTELRGRDLACWCPLDQPCHADVLLSLANSDSTQG